jgi:hypothetical protein
LSEKIASLADAHDRLDWPHDVVSAMRALKALADRVQGVVDSAATGGSKIGDLAATLSVGAKPDRTKRSKKQPR